MKYGSARKGKPIKSWVLVLFLQRIFVQAAIPPMGCWCWCPISARSWAEAFPTRALRFEGDRLWVPRRGRAKSRADASRPIRARKVVVVCSSAGTRAQRFPRRRAPDTKRGVLMGNGGGHGTRYGHRQDGRAHGHGHRDLAAATRQLVLASASAGTAARRTRHERSRWHLRHIRFCEPWAFARHRLRTAHARRWSHGRRDHAAVFPGRRAGCRGAWRHGTRTCFRAPATVLLVGRASCVEQNL